MSLFWDILNGSYSACLGWTGWLHCCFTFRWRKQCPSLIFAAVANTLLQSNFAREVSLGLQFQVTVIMKGSQDKVGARGQVCVLFHTALHPSKEGTLLSKGHGRTSEDVACWLSGRLLLSQLSHPVQDYLPME